MTRPADDTFADSRRRLTAGLIVRLVDHLAMRPLGRLGRTLCVAVQDEDVDAVARHAAEARDWPRVATTRTTTPSPCLREIARELQADRTGLLSHLVRRVHDVLNEDAALRIVVIRGPDRLGGAWLPLALLADHPRLLLVVVTTRRVMTRMRAEPLDLTTAAHREHTGRLLVRLSRWRGRKRPAWTG